MSIRRSASWIVPALFAPLCGLVVAAAVETPAAPVVATEEAQQVEDRQVKVWARKE